MDLVVLGFDGAYGRVADFVSSWKADRQREQQTSGSGTFVVAHTSCKAFAVRGYPLLTHEMLFDALRQAFRVWAAFRGTGYSITCRTAVYRIGSGKARQVNARFGAHLLAKKGQSLPLRARFL